MESVEHLTLPLLVAAGAALLAIVASHVGNRLSIPTPAIFLAAGLTANVIANHGEPGVDADLVAQVGTVALVFILFEGGFTGGWNRMRSSIVPVLSLGLVGTFATTLLLAGAAHWLLGLGWESSLLIAIALAPTDPAAVFSILGSRDVRGRSSAIIEGESGANDPVGIAMMLGALEYLDGHGSIASTALTFTLELVVGVACGAAIGWSAGRVLASVRLRSTQLLPLAAIASAFAIYAFTVLAHGSGFLAVLVAGLLMGDMLRHDAAVEGLVGIGSALAEITMFTLLGLMVRPEALGEAFALGIGTFALLTFVIRPLVVGSLLVPVDLTRSERAFIAWGGLKGAVPVLLATFVLVANEPDAEHLFSAVFVAVAASIVLQGGTIPWLIGRLGLADDPPSSR